MKRPYHHGDLKSALLAAAEAILTTEGLAALTLRAVARRVGVSHMAPTPHFGDLTGLLSELAAVGYQRFNTTLEAARANPGPRSPAAAAAHGYVRFAQENPALFQLMFRSERLDFARPSLQIAAQAASALLMRTVAAEPTPIGPSLASLGQAAGNWALVHGFAVLLVDGRLAPLLNAPNCAGDIPALLDAALAA